MDRNYWKGYLANLGLMLAGFLVTIVLILVIVSVGLSHATQEVLAAVALVPMLLAIGVSHYRIIRDARRTPAALRYRKLPLWQRLTPLLIFAVGLALAKLLKTEGASTRYVHTSSWTGLALAAVIVMLLRRRSRHL